LQVSSTFVFLIAPDAFHHSPGAGRRIASLSCVYTHARSGHIVSWAVHRLYTQSHCSYFLDQTNSQWGRFDRRSAVWEKWSLVFGVAAVVQSLSLVDRRVPRDLPRRLGKSVFLTALGR
jgi:hypothetical protein